jgi:hypothetical protein
MIEGNTLTNTHQPQAETSKLSSLSVLKAITCTWGMGYVNCGE